MSDRSQRFAELTIADLLDFDEILRGAPDVVSGHERLDNTVRWVHIADSEQVGQFLEGGECVLSTGLSYRSSVEAAAGFLDQLESVPAAGAVIELIDETGQADEDALRIIAEAAAGRDLPIILLRRRIKFVRVTELAHQELLNRQLARMERVRRAHETFTQLSLERAGAEDIVARTSELLGSLVVLEDVGHRVLTHSGGGEDAPRILAGWAGPAGRLGGGEGPGAQWLQTPVGLRERRWGRLVAPGHTVADAEAAQIIERAAQALTLARMADRDEQDLLVQAQGGLIREIADSTELDEDTARGRARALGFAPRDRMVPVVVRIDRGQAPDPTHLQLQERTLLQQLVESAHRHRCSTLATGLQSGSFGVVLALPASADEDAMLKRVLSHLPHRETTIGAARSTTSLLTAAARLESAAQVAEIASTLDLRQRLYYRFSDVRLRGLLTSLAENQALSAFAEAELGPLLEAEDEEILDFLELFLSHGGNKSAVARAGFLSRPALYARIAKLQDRLGVSLDDAESRTALHVALLWWRVRRRR
ncbi:purine catabolism regulator [Brevibacterium sanguinis]|uniref:Purine catabolism regulator n=2 Tax=Brevibacterium TaxID=1696 RepID=A0A366IJP0_9MICO|nr:purine catabolism regulator [Brevibacterium sanguinis]RBP72350.1 purine catabolism regulator [Brevibacterium celere]